jgi:hypothetical protein
MNEVGKLASNIKYIHVAIPIIISTFYEQGNILKSYLKVRQTLLPQKFTVSISLTQLKTQDCGDSENFQKS